MNLFITKAVRILFKRTTFTLVSIVSVLFTACNNETEVQGRDGEGFLLFNDREYEVGYIALDPDLNFLTTGNEPRFELGPLQINVNYVELVENPFVEEATEQWGMEVPEAVGLDVTLVATSDDIYLEDPDDIRSVIWEGAEDVDFSNDHFKVETSDGEFFEEPNETATREQITMDNFIYLNDRVQQRIVLWYPLEEGSIEEMDRVDFHIFAPQDAETNEPLSNDLKIQLDVYE